MYVYVYNKVVNIKLHYFLSFHYIIWITLIQNFYSIYNNRPRKSPNFIVTRVLWARYRIISLKALLSCYLQA